MWERRVVCTPWATAELGNIKTVPTTSTRMHTGIAQFDLVMSFEGLVASQRFLAPASVGGKADDGGSVKPAISWPVTVSGPCLLTASRSATLAGKQGELQIRHECSVHDISHSRQTAGV